MEASRTCHQRPVALRTSPVQVRPRSIFGEVTVKRHEEDCVTWYPYFFFRPRDRGNTAMLLENAIKRIHTVPDGWVRVEQVHNMPGGLELCLGIHSGRRGKMVAAWAVRCLRVHELLCGEPHNRSMTSKQLGPRKDDDLPLPINIVKFQPGHFSGSDAINGDQHQDGAIADCRRLIARNSINGFAHIVPCRCGRQRLVLKHTRGHDRSCNAGAAPLSHLCISEE